MIKSKKDYIMFLEQDRKELGKTYKNVKFLEITFGDFRYC